MAKGVTLVVITIACDVSRRIVKVLIVGPVVVEKGAEWVTMAGGQGRDVGGEGGHSNYSQHGHQHSRRKQFSFPTAILSFGI